MQATIRSFHACLPVLCALYVAACAHRGAIPQPGSTFQVFECASPGESEAQAFGRTINLAHQVDYLEVISHGGGHDAARVVERGTACSTATNGSACTDELMRRKQSWLDAQPACESCPGATMVLTTRGDEVAQWTRPEQLLKLLGAIDSPGDAWLLLMLRTGHPPYSCGDAESSGYRVMPDGIQLLRREWVSTCRPIERVEIVESFAPDGRVTTVRRTVVEREPEGCFVP